MIKFEHTEVIGWEHAIRGMRNPMNSWYRSDSEVSVCECERWPHDIKKSFACLGSNDHDLMMRLVKGGPVHAKYRRMIAVYVDITAPLYWWKEFDTYKVGTVANSCSTMHKIAAKEFTLEDFSCEHLIGRDIADTVSYNDMHHDKINDSYWAAGDILDLTIKVLNFYRQKYLETKDKKYWWQMIQLLPSSYNQKRTIMLNYEVLANIYKSRYDHRIDEWRELCQWIETLPYSEIITGFSYKEHKELVEYVEELLKTPYESIENYLKDKWPTTPEEIKEALDDWYRLIERIKSGEIPTTIYLPSGLEAVPVQELKKAIDPAERTSDVSTAMTNIMNRLQEEHQNRKDEV